MARPPPDLQLPEYGSLIGPWSVRERIGSGSHGVVFRAVNTQRPKAGHYALKLASVAGDARFEREAHLLSRVGHPSVPRFESGGFWRGPRGEVYPYVVMQWVEGMSLYAWAQEYGLTLRQALRQLAQVARALEATHRHGVHRDVKGGNVRVSPEGHAVLLDFGSCWYPDAPPLTDGDMPPGTPQYRSPGLVFFEYALRLGAKAPYTTQSEDDLYALGITAYRLLAGAYPALELDSEGEPTGVVVLEAPRGLNEVCPELSQLILRLLSEDPQARGSATKVAKELERLSKSSRTALDEPWVANATRQPTEKAKPPAPREYALGRLAPRLALGGSLIAVMLLWVLMPRDVDRTAVASTEPQSEPQAAEQPDAGTSLGEEGLASVTPAETPPVVEGKMTSEIPEKPGKNQKRPPCPDQEAKVINGGCWAQVNSRAPCFPGLYEHEGRCYFPVPNNPVRTPTSDEPQ